MLRRVVVALVILGSTVGLYAYYRAPLAVVVVRPTRGPAVEAIYATGSVEPVLWAKVSPLGPDRITAILVDEGERVVQGAVLARLDDQMERARVAEMEAQVEFLRSEFKRFGQLYEEELATRQSYERAASQLKQAEAALRAAREAVAEKQHVAPIAGIVLRKDGEVGEVVDKGTVVFWIGEPTPLRVTAEVDEEDVARCRPGQHALI
ncbi:MAG: efflux RND transporter periplasmic adaptor subunit, partial [Candidatus Binatia bacterium]